MSCIKTRLSVRYHLQGCKLTQKPRYIQLSLGSINWTKAQNVFRFLGDSIIVGRLIQHIVSSLRASSISEYRELILELYGLERALHEIEHLKCYPSQEPAVSGIKVAALMCQYPLDEFAGKSKKFDSLITCNVACSSRMDKMRLLGKKLRWDFCMEEEVMKLRAYLVAHVGSLSMRQITQDL